MSTRKKDIPVGKNKVLPSAEIYFYFMVHVSSVAYIIYCVYTASKKYEGLLNLYDFDSGWTFIPREKDISNYEWYFFYNLFWSIGHWYIAYIALDCLAVHYLTLVHRRYVGLIFSLVVLTLILGFKSLLLLCAHSIFMLTVVCYVRSKSVVWILSIILISTLNFEPFISWMKLLNPGDSDGKLYYMLMFTLALVHLKYTSFCLEKCSSVMSDTIAEHAVDSDTLKNDTIAEHAVDSDTLYLEKEQNELGKKNELMKFSLIDAFFYIFYFPLFFSGPIITYDEFSQQMNESKEKSFREGRLISASFLALRCVFWAFFNEFILHFFYFNALQRNLSVIRDMDLETLSGMGYCQGQFFMIKYTVMFGLPTVVARVCGMDPPDGPKCIGHIYSYSDMWKYFDRGMYSFIKRYIYIPLGGGRGNLLQKLLCSLACFIFVYIWHGIEYYIFLWTLFNFIGILLEVLGNWIDHQPIVCRFKSYMPGTYRRLQGLAVVPMFIMSTFTAFCFFGGSVVGFIYYQKFIVNGWLKSWIVLIVLIYCCIQSSMEIHICQRRKQNKKSK